MTDDYEKAVDFDEEAKRILTSEQERAAVDAKRAAGLAAWVFGVILILLLAWQLVRSIFFGAHFSWFSLVFLLGIYAFALVAGRIDLRLSASRDMRDARLIRVELKLDRLLDLSEEVSERLKDRTARDSSWHENRLELPDKLEEQPSEKNPISEELNKRLEELRVQAKLARLFARIEKDLRELRKNVMTAQFAKEDEEGFIPQKVLNSGRRFRFSAGENYARLDAVAAIDIIEEGLDHFETDKWGTADLELSISRCMSLESLQEAVRQKASESRSASLNEICSSLSWIGNTVDTIRESAAFERLEKRVERGDASAMYELGIAYLDGRSEIHQDYEEAYYWLYLTTVAKLALKPAETGAVTGARDEAASHLTPADLSRVQGRAKKWIRDHFDDLSKLMPARRAHGRPPLPP